MKGFLICTGKRAAQHPLYIYETKTNIYSVEELCYYIYNNIETLDEQIFNVQMVDFFIRCDRSDLAGYLEKVISAEVPVSVEEVIRNIFRKVNYYDRAEIEELCNKIRRLSEKPVEERIRATGDALLNAGKYAMAEKKYRRLLDMGVSDKISPDFYGAVWHNLGVVYARMMYFELASECFEAAYKLWPEEKVKKAWFMALRFTKDKLMSDRLMKNEAYADEWQRELEAKEADVDAHLAENGEVNSLIKLRDAGEIVSYREKVNKLIEIWKTQYREQVK